MAIKKNIPPRFSYEEDYPSYNTRKAWAESVLKDSTQSFILLIGPNDISFLNEEDIQTQVTGYLVTAPKFLAGAQTERFIARLDHILARTGLKTPMIYSRQAYFLQDDLIESTPNTLAALYVSCNLDTKSYLFFKKENPKAAHSSHHRNSAPTFSNTVPASRYSKALPSLNEALDQENKNGTDTFISLLVKQGFHVLPAPWMVKHYPQQLKDNSFLEEARHFLLNDKLSTTLKEELLITVPPLQKKAFKTL